MNLSLKHKLMLQSLSPLAFLTIVRNFKFTLVSELAPTGPKSILLELSYSFPVSSDRTISSFNILINAAASFCEEITI